MSYLCNCSTGPNSAVLHYGGASEPNTRVFKSTDMAVRAPQFLAAFHFIPFVLGDADL
jgi:hypothetical protein